MGPDVALQSMGKLHEPSSFNSSQSTQLGVIISFFFLICLQNAPHKSVLQSMAYFWNIYSLWYLLEQEDQLESNIADSKTWVSNPRDFLVKPLNSKQMEGGNELCTWVLCWNGRTTLCLELTMDLKLFTEQEILYDFFTNIYFWKA